jgi:hypothetical protein
LQELLKLDGGGLDGDGLGGGGLGSDGLAHGGYLPDAQAKKKGYDDPWPHFTKLINYFEKGYKKRSNGAVGGSEVRLRAGRAMTGIGAGQNCGAQNRDIARVRVYGGPDWRCIICAHWLFEIEQYGRRRDSQPRGIEKMACHWGIYVSTSTIWSVIFFRLPGVS